MEKIATVILAAGKGTRMKSDRVKVLHPILGLPMLFYPVELSVNGIKAEKTIVVVGYQADRIQKAFKEFKVDFAIQEEQLGTGHAVLQAIPFLQSFNGAVLILCGDVPLVKQETLRSFIDTFKRSASALSVLTAVIENPIGYGRIIRNPAGWLEKIVEEKDATDEEKKIREINTGIYCMKTSFLREGLKEIGNKNAQGEYYLTDLVEIARKKGYRCTAYIVENPLETMGINTRVELAMANEMLRQEKLKGLMLSGVTIVDPKTTYVDRTVEVGEDTILYPNCHLQGRTKIGERCVIEPNSIILDSVIENDVTIHASSVITESNIEAGAMIGPYAHLRSLTGGKTEAKSGNHSMLRADSPISGDVPDGKPALGRRKQKNILGRRKKPGKKKG